MTTMYDSVTASDIPRDAEVVQGYNGPGFKWSQADWDMFPNVPHVHTSLSTSTDGDELDVETGAVDPNDENGIVTWVRNNPRPKVSIYANGSTHPKVKGYIDNAGLADKVVYRQAIWNGTPGSRPDDSTWAEQYAAPGFGASGHFDLSEVWDLTWLDPNFVPAPPVPAAPRVLQMGMKGDDVKALQLKLNGAGYALAVDGDFGLLTDQAVRSFQSAKGLTVDGQVGSETDTALDQAQGETPATPATPPAVPTGTDRGAIVGACQSQLGQFTGQGYNNPNRYSAELGHPTEAWCGDFVSWIFKAKGVPLPSMQDGIVTGFAYCPSAVNYGNSHSASRPSWQAEIGDIFLFDWNGDGVSDHTEIMVGKNGSTVITIGGNSGPAGGVNQHEWNCPDGIGNNNVLVTLDVSKLVDLGAVPVSVPVPVSPPAPAPSPAPTNEPAWPGRVMMLKSSHMQGSDVHEYQQRMLDRGWTAIGVVDGDFGQHTSDVTLAFQREKGLMADGQVGPNTWNEAFRTDNVT